MQSLREKHSSLRRVMTIVSLGCASLFLAGCDRSDSSASVEKTVVALDGKNTNPYGTNAAATVLLFVAVDCPISNRLMPQIQRLHEKFSPQGVKFWLVYPDPEASPDAIRQHLREFQCSVAPLRDPEHALVKLGHARVTPEAAVFDRQKNLVYRGRINDQFFDFGKARAEPTQRDLENALTAIIAGKPITNSVTLAIGCRISPLK